MCVYIYTYTYVYIYIYIYIYTHIKLVVSCSVKYSCLMKKCILREVMSSLDVNYFE